MSDSVPERIPQSLLDEFECYVLGSSKRLFVRAYLRCWQWHLAEDLVQETYLRLWTVWLTRRDSIAQVDRYVNRILDNAYYKTCRRRRPEILNDDPYQNFPVQDEAEAQDTSYDGIRRAIAELPQQQREMIRLRFYAGLSTAEAASRMGIAAKTASNYLSLAKNRLAEHEAFAAYRYTGR